MTNVDFIDVVGPASLDELVSRISDVLEAPPEPGQSTFGRQYAIDLGPEAVALLRPHPAAGRRGHAEDAYMILIDRIGEYPDAFHHARRVYDALAAATPWELALGSEDDPEEIVETRPTLEAQH
jgi:hypothetical protein